jgi:hypothetical protein
MAWLDFTTRRSTRLAGTVQPVRTFMVPMTFVSWEARSSWAESMVSAICTTVSMRSCLISFAMAA